jgi:hypothetical protein
MKKQSNLWRLLSKALGEKSGKTNQEADQIAILRLMMFLSILITNCFIVANTLRHWNDEIPSSLCPCQKEKVHTTDRR